VTPRHSSGRRPPDAAPPGSTDPETSNPWLDSLKRRAVYYRAFQAGLEDRGNIASNEFNWYKMEIHPRKADVVMGINNNIWDIAVRTDASGMVIYDRDQEVIAAQEFLYKPLLLAARSPAQFLCMLAGVPPDGIPDDAPLENVFRRIGQRLEEYSKDQEVPAERSAYVRGVVAAIRTDPRLSDLHADFVDRHLRLIIDPARRRAFREQVRREFLEEAGPDPLDNLYDTAFSAKYIVDRLDDVYPSFARRYDPGRLVQRAAWEQAQDERFVKDKTDPGEVRARVHDPFFSFLSSQTAFERLQRLFAEDRVFYLVSDVQDEKAYAALARTLGGRKVSAFSLSNIVGVAVPGAEARERMASGILKAAMSSLRMDIPFTVYQTGGGHSNVQHFYSKRTVEGGALGFQDRGPRMPGAMSFDGGPF